MLLRIGILSPLRSLSPVKARMSEYIERSIQKMNSATALLVDLSKFISPGLHHLEISRDASSAQASVQVLTEYYVPWSHAVTTEDFRHQDQASDTLRLRVQYDKSTVKIGEEVRCNVEAERLGFHGYGMLLAEIG